MIETIKLVIYHLLTISIIGSCMIKSESQCNGNMQRTSFKTEKKKLTFDLLLNSVLYCY